MPFPEREPILDTFNRPDSETGGNWTRLAESLKPEFGVGMEGAEMTTYAKDLRSAEAHMKVAAHPVLVPGYYGVSLDGDERRCWTRRPLTGWRLWYVRLLDGLSPLPYGPRLRYGDWVQVPIESELGQAINGCFHFRSIDDVTAATGPTGPPKVDDFSGGTQ